MFSRLESIGNTSKFKKGILKSVSRYIIDINCDLGEGLGNEEQLMSFISSCNIACGGHVGNLETMQHAVLLAKQHEVKIGAHPSFPDSINFGRQIVDITDKDLKNSIIDQIRNLKEVVNNMSLNLNHVKPHGALYNLASVNENTAKIVIEAIKSVDGDLILYAPFQSVVSKIAIAEGLEVKFEAFADRHYNENLTLVSRNKKNALIHDPENMFQQMCTIIYNKKVRAINGVEVDIKADTFCVHGDGDDVVENLGYLIQKLKTNNIEIL